MRIKQIIDVMEELAPARFAEEWDQIGLQVGDREAEVDTVLVALTPSFEVLDEAAARGAGLVVSHHPLIFKPLVSLTGSTPSERLAAAFLKRDVALFAAHTNLDSAPGGVNDALARRLGLANVQPLAPARIALKKIVVFVPNGAIEEVAEAMCAAGAGNIGAYRDCTFRVKGTGTFTPTPQAAPHIGTRGKSEHVVEVRIESVVTDADVPGVVAAIRQSHPYEEPVFDIYHLENKSRESGPGRWGTLPEPVTAADFIAEVSNKLNTPGLRYAGDETRQVSKVAVCGGAGGDLYKDAIAHSCEVYVTADVSYHTFVDARDEGLLLVDAGHAETELPGVGALRERLAAKLGAAHVVLSERGRRAVRRL